MLEKERQVQIMRKIRQSGFVSVKELMEELETSRSSIMRDLIDLESEGLLVREHGGASLKSAKAILNKVDELSVSDKESINLDLKDKICKKASELVKEGNCIYIDSGTTVSLLMPYIVDKNITIVTPSIHLVRDLNNDIRATVYLLGGSYDNKYDMNHGEFSNQMLKQFNFDIAFYSANGINLKSKEVMLADFELLALKNGALERSAKNYLLIDSSKLDQNAACVWTSIDTFDNIYIDNNTKTKLGNKYIVV